MQDSQLADDGFDCATEQEEKLKALNPYKTFGSGWGYYVRFKSIIFHTRGLRAYHERAAEFVNVWKCLLAAIESRLYCINTRDLRIVFA